MSFLQSPCHWQWNSNHAMGYNSWKSCSATKVSATLCGKRSFCPWHCHAVDAEGKLLNWNAQQGCASFPYFAVVSRCWSYSDIWFWWNTESINTNQDPWVDFELVHPAEHVWSVCQLIYTCLNKSSTIWSSNLFIMCILSFYCVIIKFSLY